MDSTQQPYTHRMLARSASMRMNRECDQRCSSNNSRRRPSILQAFGDQSVKIADVADCPIENGTLLVGANIGTENKQASPRRTSLASGDSLVSWQNDLPGLYTKPRYSSSHLTGQSTSKDDCKIPQALPRSSNEYASDPQRSTNSEYVIKCIGMEPIVKEHQNRTNSQICVSKTPPKLTTENDEECYNNETTNQVNRNNSINGVTAVSEIPIPHKPCKPPRNNLGKATIDANSMMKKQSKKSVHDSDSFKECKNSLDSTHTFNLTSVDCTGNMRKESSYTKGFELGNPKWRGPLASMYVRPQEKKDQNYFDRESKIEEMIEPFSKSSNIEEPKLLRAVHKEILVPPKMMAEKKTIGNSDGKIKGSLNSKRNKLSLSINVAEDTTKQKGANGFESIPENRDLPITPISEEIKRLEAEIESLKLDSNQFYTPENATKSVTSLPSQIYPNLSKMWFDPTGYSPEKLTYQSPGSPEKYSASTSSKIPAIIGKKDPEDFEKNSTSPPSDSPENIQSPGPFTDVSKNRMKNIDEEDVPGNGQKLDPERPTINTKTNSTAFNQDTSVNANIENGRVVENNSKEIEIDKFKPNLESTRKSAFTDLSKNTASPDPQEHAISSVTIPSNFSKNLGRTRTSTFSDQKIVALNSIVPYNIDNFLKDAIGDELDNTFLTFPPSEAQDGTISQFNASELASHEKRPFRKINKSSSKRTPMSEFSRQRPSTFNRTKTIYRSLSRGIKNKLRPAGVRPVPKAVTNDSAITSEDSTCEDKNIQALMQVVKIQETVMHQANKALMVCNSRKEFRGSTEQVESARLFLLAELRTAAALEEINKLKLKNTDDQQCYEKGEIAMKDFSLPLKEDILNDETLSEDFVEWFVIAVSQGPTVWATRAVSCPIKSRTIIFIGEILFPDVSPNFKITVRVYSLKMRMTTFNHNDKYHINQDEKQSTCPSPKKLILRKTDRTLSPKQVQQIEFPPEIENTFVLSGMVELYLHDLSLASPWPLICLLPGSILRGTIDLTVSCKLHLSISHTGFLTHGNKLGSLVDWNRRWCVLEGKILKFWNYPCDQEDKEPLAIIDLTNCISKVITVADRSLCAKPRTLLIETARRSIMDRNSMLMECHLSHTIVRNLLCCDTMRELNQWISKLNQVISALRDWNLNDRYPDVRVSDL